MGGSPHAHLASATQYRKHRTQNNNMKKLFVTTAVAFSAMLLLTGCLALQIGGGDTKSEKKTTVGQQLVDLKAAHDSGAISDADYETQKAKVLGAK